MIASKGEIFGLEDIFCGRKLTTSVKCITKVGYVLKIKKEDFLRIIQKDEFAQKYLNVVKEERDESTIGKLKQAENVFNSFRETTSNLLKHNDEGSFLVNN